MCKRKKQQNIRNEHWCEVNRMVLNYQLHNLQFQKMGRKSKYFEVSVCIAVIIYHGSSQLNRTESIQQCENTQKKKYCTIPVHKKRFLSDYLKTPTVHPNNE